MATFKELVEETIKSGAILIQGVDVGKKRNEKDEEGTYYSIKFVENFYNDTILLMNSDVFTNIDFEDFYIHFKQHDAEMSVVAIPYTVSVPYGIFDLDGRDVKREESYL